MQSRVLVPAIEKEVAMQEATGSEEKLSYFIPGDCLFFVLFLVGSQIIC